MPFEPRPIRVLFVCLGNICRSPLAEGVFRAEVFGAGLSGRIEVDSVGTGHWHIGDPPHERSRAVAKERGFSIDDLRGRQIDPLDFSRFDYVIAMDRNNLADLRYMAPSSQHRKIGLFLSYASDAGAQVEEDEVPDPYGYPIETYRETLDLCEIAAKGLLAYIRNKEGL